jgi:hypothetical protein
MDAAATIAMYNNRPAASRDAALRGLAQAPDASPAAVRASCQLMRANARLGDADKFAAALDDTRRRLDAVEVPGTGLFACDAGRIASYAATSSIWLRRPNAAVVYAQEALNFYQSVPADQRSPTREAISQLDLGLALIHLDEPDGGVEHAVRALGTERVTDAMLTRAREVSQTLDARFSTLKAASEFREKCRALAAATGRPQLTAG